MNILVLAYAISPIRGSEYSVAWNHICQMSELHSLTVLYGCSGDHLGDNIELPEYLKNSQLNNVTWHFVKPDKTTKKLNILNKKNIFHYSFYFAYKRWHKSVYNYCIKNLNLESFDLIHFLNPIGYREPGYLWKFDKPYIWGPIGGTTSVDFRLLSALPFAGKVKLLFRKIVNNFQLNASFRVKRAIKNTDLLLSATSENQEIIKLYFQKESIYIPENGPIGEFEKIFPKNFSQKKPIRFIWIGSIEARKGLVMLLEALCLLPNNLNFIIDICGDGPMKTALEKFALKNGISDKLVWHGSIPREKVLEKIKFSDCHIITSVSEGNPTTIWEVIQKGIPTISISHCGMKDTIGSGSGIKIELAQYKILISQFSIAIGKLVNSPNCLNKMSLNVEKDFYAYHWNNRASRINSFYSKAIENYRLRKTSRSG